MFKLRNFFILAAFLCVLCCHPASKNTSPTLKAIEHVAKAVHILENQYAKDPEAAIGNYVKATKHAHDSLVAALIKAKDSKFPDSIKPIQKQLETTTTCLFSDHNPLEKRGDDQCPPLSLIPGIDDMLQIVAPTPQLNEVTLSIYQTLGLNGVMILSIAYGYLWIKFLLSGPDNPVENELTDLREQAVFAMIIITAHVFYQAATQLVLKQLEYKPFIVVLAGMVFLNIVIHRLNVSLRRTINQS
jgi:hypothetical protein